MSDRMTCDEWYVRNENEIKSRQLQLALWDWQNERAEFLDLLRSVEWANETIDGVAICPECGASRDEGHRNGCRLGAVLA